MSFPDTQDALQRAGWRFKNTTQCKGCFEQIEWWTTPQGRPAPMNPMPERYSPAVSHFATCKQAQLFR